MVHPCLRVTRLSNDKRGRRVHFEDEHNPELKQVYRSVVFTNLKLSNGLRVVEPQGT